MASILTTKEHHRELAIASDRFARSPGPVEVKRAEKVLICTKMEHKSNPIDAMSFLLGKRLLFFFDPEERRGEIEKKRADQFG